MAEEFDTVTIPELNDFTLELTSFFATSNINGKLGKATVQQLVTFMAPYIQGVASSGFVATTGTVLPTPTAGKFTFVSSGTFTQTTGGNIVTTQLLNLLLANGTSWSLILAIPIVIPDSKTAVWTAKVYASDAVVSYLGKYWRSNAATLSTDIPGTSTKWVEDLVYAKFNNTYGPNLYAGAIIANSAFTANTTTGAYTSGSATGNDLTTFIPVPVGAKIRLSTTNGDNVSSVVWLFTAQASGTGYFRLTTDVVAMPFVEFIVPSPGNGATMVYLLTYTRAVHISTNIKSVLQVRQKTGFSLSSKEDSLNILSKEEINALFSSLNIGGITRRFGNINVYDGIGEMIGYGFANNYPVINAPYALTNWVPIKPGMSYKIYRSDGGLFSPSIFIYDQNKSNSRRMFTTTEKPTTSFESLIEFTAGESDHYLLAYSKYNTSYTPLDINSLLVFEEQHSMSEGDITIQVNGQNVTASEIVESQLDTIVDLVGEKDAPYNPVIADYPFINIPTEIAATDANAPIKIPPTWSYRDLILNVMEVFRTNNPDYVSLLGDYTQTVDPALPAQSIGLSIASGSRARYPIYLYDFKPKQYEQTAIIFANEHGDEREAAVGLLRMMQIIVNDWKAYPSLSYLRHKVRFIICPVLSPYGYMAPDRLNAAGVNVNRNWDHNWQSSDNSTYPGTNDYSGIGSAPMIAENQILLDAIRPYLNEANWGFSCHSGTPTEPYWMNCPVDSLNRQPTEATAKWLAAKRSVSYPSDFRDMTGPIDFSAVSAHYFSRVLNIPFLTMDYSVNRWGVRYGTLAMTIQVEQLINMAIAHSYANLKPRKTLTSGKLFSSRRLPSAISIEFGHVYNASQSMIERIYGNLVNAYPDKVTRTVIGQSLGGKYNVLSFEVSPENPQRTVIVVGGLHTKISQTSFHADTVNYTDGLRHVMSLPYILHDILSNTEDAILTELRENVRIVIVPVANPNDTYDAVNTADINSLFGTDTHLAGFNARPECVAIANLISAYPDADIIDFNEIIDTTEDVQFILNSGYPYQYRTGNSSLREYFEVLLPKTERTVSVSVDETGTAPNNSLLNWAYFNKGCNGVQIRSRDISALSEKTWDSPQVTELMNFFINVVNRI